MSVILKINDYDLIDIMAPEDAIKCHTEEEKFEASILLQLYPSEVYLTSETYSKDTERTANYEMEQVTLVNRKSKPEFTWDCIKAVYVRRLLNFLSYKYNFKNAEGDIVPEKAPTFKVEYNDFIGVRVITSYLGQTIEGTLEDNGGTLYWRDFRIAFPEM